MNTAIVILMAGASRRMGQPKALVTVRGRPLLAHPLDAALSADVDDVILVLGPDHRLVQAGVDTSGARVVVNPAPDRGLSSSLAIGVDAAGAEVDRVCVLLGDQPNVDGRLIRRLLRLHERSGRPAAAVCAGGVVMPPAVISGVFIAMARDGAGDVGLRGALRAHPELVAVLAVAGRAVQDVDTMEDLDRVAR